MNQLDDWSASGRRAYFGLLDNWNRQEAAAMAARFAGAR